MKNLKKISVLLFLILLSCNKIEQEGNSTLPLYDTITTLSKINPVYDEYTSEKIDCANQPNFEPIIFKNKIVEEIKNNTSLQNIHTGILVDACTFGEYLVSLQDNKRLKIENKSLKSLREDELNLIKDYEIKYLNENNELKKEILKTQSWYEQNKTLLGIVVGFVIGTGVTIAIVYGINNVE